MKYQLKCLKTGDIINDNYTLHYTDNALLQAVYHEPFELQPDEEGVWQFLSWMPVSTSNDYVAGTVTYRAEALGKAMGLSNLWVNFNGYWPEKGGLCPTGSFKDMEAVPTIQRLHDHDGQGLICASAGNTARAFSHFCGLDGVPLIVVVGKAHAKRIWRAQKTLLTAFGLSWLKTVTTTMRKRSPRALLLNYRVGRWRAASTTWRGATALAASCLMLLSPLAAFPTITSRHRRWAGPHWHSRDGGPLD